MKSTLHLTLNVPRATELYGNPVPIAGWINIHCAFDGVRINNGLSRHGEFVGNMRVSRDVPHHILAKIIKTVSTNLG